MIFNRVEEEVIMATIQVDPERRNPRPRMLTQDERAKLDKFIETIHYSARYGSDRCPLR